jgi:hypothetical protein
MKEELIALGKILQNDFEDLVSHQITGSLINASLADADAAQLRELEMELSSFLAINNQFAALEAWLTSGFMPGELSDLGLTTEEWTAEAKSESVDISSFLVNSHNLISKPQEESELLSSANPTEYSSIQEIKNITGNEVLPSPVSRQHLTDIHEVSTPTFTTIRDEKTKNSTETKLSADFETLPQNLADIDELSTPDSILNPEIKEVKNITNDAGWRSPLELQDLDNVGKYSIPIFAENTESKNLKHTTLNQKRSPLGLKDLANFLATEPYSDNSEAVINQKTSIDNFPRQNSGDWEQLEENNKRNWTELISHTITQNDFPTFESNSIASSNQEIPQPFISQPTEAQYEDRELQIEIERNATKNESNTEIDIDLIFQALAQEINREYHQFYGN